MKVKLKICSSCQIPSVIWKNSDRNRYCKSCWLKLTPTKQVAKKQYSIPFRAPERSKEEKLYQGKRIIFLTKHSMCRMHLSGCTQRSSDVHHSQGREGDLLLDESKWIECCRVCHDYTEAHPEEAKILGFSLDRL